MELKAGKSTVRSPHLRQLRFRCHGLSVVSVGILCGATLLAAGCAAHAPARRCEGVHLDLYCDLPAGAPDALLAEGDRHVERVSTFMRLSVPRERLRVYVFSCHWSLSLFLIRACPRQWDRGAACFETAEGFVAAIARQWRRKDTLRYLRHELTHYVLASHFCDLPPWIDEGLAQYCEADPPFERHCHENLKRAGRGIASETGVLEGLVSIPAGERLTRKQYAQSHALVCFLMDSERFGLEPILRYLRCVRSDRAGREYFQQCFGEWPCDLEEEWRAFLRGQQSHLSAR